MVRYVYFHRVQAVSPSISCHLHIIWVQATIMDEVSLVEEAWVIVLELWRGSHVMGGRSLVLHDGVSLDLYLRVGPLLTAPDRSLSGAGAAGQGTND